MFDFLLGFIVDVAKAFIAWFLLRETLFPLIKRHLMREGSRNMAIWFHVFEGHTNHPTECSIGRCQVFQTAS